VSWDRAADLELELATLEAEVEAFRADYLRAVGILIAEHHEVMARIADLGSDPVAAAAAHEDVRRSRADLAAVPAPAGPPPTEDLKLLYRRAAKAMHPDHAADAAARVHGEAFMRRLNAAYRAGDADTIADLVRQWEAGGHPVAPAGSPAAASAAVASAERRLAALRGSEFARLLDESIAAALRGEDLLSQLRERWTAALAEARARLAALTPG
jgi:hypothetical protein